MDVLPWLPHARMAMHVETRVDCFKSHMRMNSPSLHTTLPNRHKIWAMCLWRHGCCWQNILCFSSYMSNDQHQVTDRQSDWHDWTGLTPVLALTQSCCLLSGYIHTLVSQCGQTSDYSSSSIGLGHTMGKTSLIIPCSINSVCPVSVFQDNHCKWWHGHLTSMSTWVIWSYFAYYFWARH